MKRQVRDISFLTLLQRHERALARLYRMVAETQTEGAALWRQLCAARAEHAARLGELAQAVRSGKATLAGKRFPIRELNVSLAALEARIQSWKHWGVPRREALEYAGMLQEHLLRSDFYLPYYGDSKELAKTLSSFWFDTEEDDHQLREIAREKHAGWWHRILNRVARIAALQLF